MCGITDDNYFYPFPPHLRVISIRENNILGATAVGSLFLDIHMEYWFEDTAEISIIAALEELTV